MAYEENLATAVFKAAVDTGADYARKKRAYQAEQRAERKEMLKFAMDQARLKMQTNIATANVLTQQIQQKIAERKQDWEEGAPERKKQEREDIATEQEEERKRKIGVLQEYGKANPTLTGVIQARIAELESGIEGLVDHAEIERLIQLSDAVGGTEADKKLRRQQIRKIPGAAKRLELQITEQAKTDASAAERERLNTAIDAIPDDTASPAVKSAMKSIATGISGSDKLLEQVLDEEEKERIIEWAKTNDPDNAATIEKGLNTGSFGQELIKQEERHEKRIAEIEARENQTPMTATQIKREQSKTAISDFIEDRAETIGLPSELQSQVSASIANDDIKPAVDAIAAFVESKPIDQSWTKAQRNAALDEVYELRQLAGDLPLLQQELGSLPVDVQLAMANVTSNLQPHLKAGKIENLLTVANIDNQQALRSNQENRYDRTKHLLAKYAYDELYAQQTMVAIGRQNMLSSIDLIEKQVDVLQNKGVDLDLITGTIDEVYRKLGDVEEPDVRQAAVMMRMALFAYRRAMSGAAFTIAETAEYEKVFPNASQNWESIQAQIDGVKTILLSEQGGFFGRYLGPDGANFIADRKRASVYDVLKWGGQTDEEINNLLPNVLPELQSDPIATEVRQLLDEGVSAFEVQQELQKLGIDDAEIDRYLR